MYYTARNNQNVTTSKCLDSKQAPLALNRHLREAGGRGSGRRGRVTRGTLTIILMDPFFALQHPSQPRARHMTGWENVQHTITNNVHHSRIKHRPVLFPPYLTFHNTRLVNFTVLEEKQIYRVFFVRSRERFLWGLPFLPSPPPLRHHVSPWSSLHKSDVPINLLTFLWLE